MLYELLTDNGTVAALERLGFSPAEMFAGIDVETEELYSAYYWDVHECHVPGVDLEYVVNAIPEDFEKCAWEEWYASEGKLIHHVLCQSKWPECTDEAEIPADDKDHPEAIIGKKWFYFEDENLKPFFAKQSK